jgi:hypothetical protein
MARPRADTKFPKARRFWRADLLAKTRQAAKTMVRNGSLPATDESRLPQIMNSLIFGEDRKDEAELVFQHLIFECSKEGTVYAKAERMAFMIMLGCAYSILEQERVFPFSPKEARAAIETGHPVEAIEFYRPLFEVAPDFVAWDLKRYASVAGRGTTRDTSVPKISFIVQMTRMLRGKDGKLLESLFERLYMFTFWEKIRVADHRNLITWAESGMKGKDPFPRFLEKISSGA